MVIAANWSDECLLKHVIFLFLQLPTYAHRSWLDQRQWKRSISTGNNFLLSARALGNRLAQSIRPGSEAVEKLPEGPSRVVEHSIEVVSVEGVHVEKWTLAVVAPAGAVDIANEKMHAQVQLTPQVAVAVCTLTAVSGAKGGGKAAPCSDGEGQMGQSTTSSTGSPGASTLLSPWPLRPPSASEPSQLFTLPFTLCGHWALTRTGGRRLMFMSDSPSSEAPSPPGAETSEQLKMRFNRELLRGSAAALCTLLEYMLQHSPAGSSSLHIYDMLPRGIKSDSDPAAWFLCNQVSDNLSDAWGNALPCCRWACMRKKALLDLRAGVRTCSKALPVAAAHGRAGFIVAGMFPGSWWPS
jgi:hypothetical protein